MSAAALEPVLEALAAHNLDQAEVYWKRGRSRRLDFENGEWRSSLAHEEGWAVRAAGSRGSFFCARTGSPGPATPWPEPAVGALRLPEPPGREPPPPEAEPEAPWLAEVESRSLLETVGRELMAELPDARLIRASLQEGTSESDLRSSRGVVASWRSRAAVLRLEAVAGGKTAAALDLWARQAAGFRAGSVARRLADRLQVAQSGDAPERDRGEFLLSPSVGARMLVGLRPLLVGIRGTERAQRLRDRRGRIASAAVTVVDDGRFPGGATSAPYDGEGMPTRAVTLIEQGVYRQPLVSWRDAKPPEILASGCMRRAGWRDLPAPGPTHLYLRPEMQNPVARLLGSVSRGYYLLDATGPGRFDLDGDRFELPVCGFAVSSGRASAPVAKAWLCGSLGAFLRGIEAVGRDLAFQPLDGLIGSPTLLSSGLEIRRTPAF